MATPDRAQQADLTPLDCGLHILALFAFAVAQPIFDITSKGAAFFVIRGSRPIDIWALVLLLAVVLPALLVTVELLLRLGLGRRTQQVAHYALIAALGTLYLLQIARDLVPGPGWLVALTAIAAAAVATVIYSRVRPVRSFLSLASLAAIIFPVVFIASPPIAKLLFTDGSAAALRNSAVQPEQTPPLVLIVLDELPVTSLLDADGGIDSQRFPHLAAFAGTAHWYRYAMTVSADTSTSVPAILSGVKPTGKKVPTVSEHPNNLFTMLAGSYRMKIFEEATLLCPADLRAATVGAADFPSRVSSMIVDLSVVYLHAITPEPWIAKLPPINIGWGNFLDDELHGHAGHPTTEAPASTSGIPDAKELGEWIHGNIWGDRDLRYQDFLDTIDGRFPASFHFFHWLMPHRPWIYLPSGKQYLTRRKIDGVEQAGDDWTGPQFLVDQFHNRHLLQLAYTDKRLGDLFARLRELDLFDEALITIVADHGACFTTDDKWRDITTSNIGELAFVPLLIKVPGQKTGEIHDGYVTTVDILPTIAGALGVEPPWKVDGINLLAENTKAQEELSIIDFRGRLWDFSLSLLGDEEERIARRNIDLFGLDNPNRSLYGAGPHLELMGRPVAEFPVIEASFSYELEQQPLLAAVDPESRFLPASITGHIKGVTIEDQPGRAALAVNGRIAGLADIYHFGGALRLSGLVDEGSFKAGDNRLDLYLIEIDAAGEVVLRGSSSADRDAAAGRLSVDPTTGFLFREDGRRYPIVQMAEIRGKVEEVISKDGVVTMIGWAADFPKREPLDWIAVFDGGRLLYSSDSFIEREHVAKYLGVPKDTAFGCQLVMPSSRVQSLTTTPLFFALSESSQSATQLRFTADAIAQLANVIAASKLVEGELFRLRGDKLSLVTGETVEITAGAVSGSIDLAERSDTALSFAGWAAETRASRPAAAVLCFVDGVFSGSRLPELERPDVARHYDDPALLRSGFSLSLAADYLRDRYSLEIRFIAISEAGRASELKYPADYPFAAIR